jgi:phosphoribosylformylglycinamidine cyclo-ligase
MIATVVQGVAAACQAAGCALLGGETAEMPGVYQAGEFDLVGTVVGMVDRARIIDGSAIRPGDQVIGLASSGLHTNGFSLARRVLAERDLERPLPELDQSLGEALLAPHRCYLPQVTALQQAGVAIAGLAHITGGGLVDNPPRILPRGTAMRLRQGGWPVPPVFGLIQRAGRIDGAEMAHVFNLGLGMLAVLPATRVDRALAAVGADAWHVGEIVASNGEPHVRID